MLFEAPERSKAVEGRVAAKRPGGGGSSGHRAHCGRVRHSINSAERAEALRIRAHEFAGKAKVPYLARQGEQRDCKP